MMVIFKYDQWLKVILQVLFSSSPVCVLSVPLQDFESNNELKTKVIAFLEEVMHDPELLTQERKAAANIIRYRCVPFDRGTENSFCKPNIWKNTVLFCTHFRAWPSLLLYVRTLTQEDHGDNQISLEDVTQLVSEVSRCCPCEWVLKFNLEPFKTCRKQDCNTNMQIYPPLVDP